MVAGECVADEGAGGAGPAGGGFLVGGMACCAPPPLTAAALILLLFGVQRAQRQDNTEYQDDKKRDGRFDELSKY